MVTIVIILIVTAMLSYGHSCHHILHKITAVLEIDLTTDSYLTAFLE